MRTFTRAIAGVLGTAVVLLGIITLLSHTLLAGSPLMDGLATGAANAALEASGVKGRIDGALRENAGAIASATGLSEQQVNEAIDQLAIDSWSATVLPDDAVATGNYSASYGGVDGTVTTYADPSYVTLDAYGQSLTLAVPPSAQNYVGYLSYLSYLG